MTESWTRPIEQIVLSETGQRDRIIGFTAPEPHSGVSRLSHDVAEVFALSGFNTLLVDLSPSVRDSPQPVQDSPQPLWLPGTGNSRTCITRHERGFDFVTARMTVGTRFSFNNVNQIRQMLSVELADYAKVVLDLPAIHDLRSQVVNPVAGAAACDSVLLVCVRGGVTRARLKSAVELLRAAGCKLTGTVLNGENYDTSGAEISRAVRRVFRSAPPIANWLERQALSIEALN